MSLTKSAARTRVRARIRDNVTSYEWSDVALDTYISPALKEIATFVRSITPDFYLRSQTIAAYTQALDPVASGDCGFEMHQLPATFSAFRWCERLSSTGHPQYRIPETGTTNQEANRYGGANLGFTRVAVNNEGTPDYYGLASLTGRETISIHGKRFRLVPPPAEAMTLRIWFDAAPADPSGESEVLDIPDEVEEAFVRVWGRSVLEDGGDPAMAAVQEKAAQREMGTARSALGKRTGRNMTVGPVW